MDKSLWIDKDLKMLNAPRDVLIVHIASRLDAKSMCNVSSSCTSLRTILTESVKDKRILHDHKCVLTELIDKTRRIYCTLEIFPVYERYHDGIAVKGMYMSHGKIYYSPQYWGFACLANPQHWDLTYLAEKNSVHNHRIM